MPKVSVVVGSKSDLELAEKAVEILRELGIDYDVQVLSAHRNPKELEEYISKSDAEVFIAIAGLSAALPGYIASRTLKPVIGVPRSVKLGGLDALLSTVQMPTGVPVACVGIDNPKNAALLAAEVLGLKYEEVRSRLVEYRRRLSRR